MVAPQPRQLWSESLANATGEGARLNLVMIPETLNTGPADSVASIMPNVVSPIGQLGGTDVDRMKTNLLLQRNQEEVFG